MGMRKNGLFFATLVLTLTTGAVINIKQESAVSVDAADADTYWGKLATSSNDADSLFSSLSTKINANTTTIGYSGLWDAYKKTDLVPGTQKIWDMYAGIQFAFQPGGESYKKVGDCFNREHSVPKSWWGTVEDERYSDIVHLVPTDGYVNNRRSNYAFGEVNGTPTYSYSFNAKNDGYGNQIQTAGISKLGGGKAINGITAPGTVFEPDDQYKGDFARIYYYFATRYGPKGKIATQDDGAKMFSNNPDNFYMTAYGKALMNKWHVQDPVSQKELDRNDGIQETQGNRNPYVDHPEWADLIFGSNYVDTNGSGTTDNKPSLSISTSSNTVEVGNTITLTANLKNVTGTVNWYIEDINQGILSLNSTSGNSITVTGEKEGTMTVWAYLGESLTSNIEITVGSAGTGGDVPIGCSGTILFGKETGKTLVNSLDANGIDSLGNNWNIKTTTAAKESFTPETGFAHIGSGSNPASTVTLSLEFEKSTIISDLSIDIGGYSGTAGKVALLVGDAIVGTGAFNGGNDVTVSIDDKFKNTSGNSIVIKITNIDKGIKIYSVSYSIGEPLGSTPTLESISLDTTKVQKEFNVDDEFNYANLVVKGHYSDGDVEEITEGYTVSSPDMSVSGNKDITVSYNGKTATYSITVNSNEKPIEYIVARSTKTYFVGETISIDDLEVKDSNGKLITNFDFDFDGYQFTYEDAKSGGDLTTKDFDNAISYESFTCPLKAQVQRKERIAISNSTVTDILTADDFVATDTAYKEFSIVSKNSDASYSGYSARTTTGYIQMRSKYNCSGIVSTVSGGDLQSVKIIVGTGNNQINVYGSNSAYSSADDLYDNTKCGTLIGSVTGTGTIKFDVDYKFVGIRSNNGAIYLSSVEIVYSTGTGSDTAENVANFIMFEDNDGQCVDKFDDAENYFNSLTLDERALFMESSDFVIKTARTRLIAWANYLGKQIEYNSDDYLITPMKLSNNVFGDDDDIIFIIAFTISSLFLTFIHISYKKAKTNNYHL